MAGVGLAAGSLKQQLRQVRKELSELLFEQQQMLQVSGPNLEARHHRLFGPLQLELEQVRLDRRRARRRLEMLRAGWQTGNRPDPVEMERQLDQELWSWRRQVAELKDKQDAAELRLRKLHTPEISAAVRSLYRQLVRLLHPDLHPQQNAEQQRLWFEVQQAYQWADWRRLETLLTVVDDDFEESKAELQRMQERLGELVASLQELRQQFPHALQSQLEDENWVQQQQGQLKLQIVLERQNLAKVVAMLQEYL